MSTALPKIESDHSAAPDKPKTLILVSYEYPYGLAETFLETEVHALAAAFDRVVVIPSRAAFSWRWLKVQQSESARKMPPGFVLWLPSALGVRAFPRLALVMARLALRARPRRSKLSSWFHVLTEALRDSLKAALFLEKTRHVFDLFSGGLAYCYWKGPATTALCLRARDGLDVIGPVTRCHGGDLYYDLPNKPARPYDPFIARHSTAVVSVSEHGLAHLLDHGFAPERLHVSRLGVSLPAEVSRPSSDGVWRIVSCSNVIPIKRVTLIARALTQLEHPFLWTHFGDGVELPEVHRIAAHFRSHGGSRLVGRCPNVDVLKFFQTDPVDLFVNLSVSEGVPVSIMEALAAGIPCIATDVGGTSEVLDNSVGRIIYPTLTAEQVAEVITSELSDVVQWEEKRKAARLRAELLCDAEVNYRNFANFLLSQMQKAEGSS